MSEPAPNRSGTAGIEYACLVAVLAVVLVCAARHLMPAIRSPLGQVTNGFDQANQPTTSNAPDAARQAGPVEGRTVPLPAVLLTLAATLLIYALWKRSRLLKPPQTVEAAIRETVQKKARSLVEKRQQILLAISTHWHTTDLRQLMVSDLMTIEPSTVSPEAMKADLDKTMRDRGLHHLLVEANGELIGVLSDRDILERDGESARDLMTPNPITTAPDADVSEAIEIMLKHRVSCVPVVRHGRLCGVLTASDVAMGFQCALRVLGQISQTLAIANPSQTNVVDSRDVPKTIRRAREA